MADVHGVPDASRVLVATTVRATAERTFTVFTNEIGQWWQPNSLFQFTPGRTGTLAFDGGQLVEEYDDGTRYLIGDVLVWDPPAVVVVGWHQTGFPDGVDTELHVRFDEVPGDSPRTRVTVEHFGWDRLPSTNAVRHGFPLSVFSHRFAEWWQRQLSALDAQATGD